MTVLYARLRELNRWNEAILPLVGIGEDCFYLNEWLGENKAILDFLRYAIMTKTITVIKRTRANSKNTTAPEAEPASPFDRIHDH